MSESTAVFFHIIHITAVTIIIFITIVSALFLLYILAETTNQSIIPPNPKRKLKKTTIFI